MNPAAILAMLSELYAQVSALRQENETLRAQLAAALESEKQDPGHA